ncbi:DoxX family protein [Natronosalvus caseinilyticus]|uniref:DoxX family protein n=1 Tax=Natronosalvus caseinilyticus TaxID=2953747 RepID=UPI0028AA87EE|nr:DoxX family protein [Natronosalvus caseinilyticus]
MLDGRRLRNRIAASWIAGVGLIWLSTSATAHEEYVVDEEREASALEFLADGLGDPAVLGPLFAGLIGVGLAMVLYLRIRPVPNDVAAFRTAMREYTEFVPWLLRISFGIPLVGAGFAGYFISPAVTLDARLLQVALGFLLLFGLATRLVAIVTLTAYLLGLLVWPTLLLQLEFVGGLLAITLVGSGRPSADHVLQRVAGGPGTEYGRIDRVHDVAQAFQSRIEPYEVYAPTIARVGLGLTFITLGVGQKLLRPGIALAVVDRYDLTSVVPVPAELWVLGAGFTEAALGLALVVGLFTRASAAVAIAMFSLTLFALPDDPVLAHVSLFGMASVLLITGAGPYAVDNRLEAVETRVEETVSSPADRPDAGESRQAR